MAQAAQVRRALDLHSDELSRKPNVVGVGRVKARSGERGEYELAVYVERKIPDDELDAEDRVPEEVEVPGRGQAVKIRTRVIEQGPVALEAEPGLEKL